MSKLEYHREIFLPITAAIESQRFGLDGFDHLIFNGVFYWNGTTNEWIRRDNIFDVNGASDPLIAIRVDDEDIVTPVQGRRFDVSEANYFTMVRTGALIAGTEYFHVTLLKRGTSSPGLYDVLPRELVDPATGGSNALGQTMAINKAHMPLVPLGERRSVTGFNLTAAGSPATINFTDTAYLFHASFHNAGGGAAAVDVSDARGLIFPMAVPTVSCKHFLPSIPIPLESPLTITVTGGSASLNYSLNLFRN